MQNHVRTAVLHHIGLSTAQETLRALALGRTKLPDKTPYIRYEIYTKIERLQPKNELIGLINYLGAVAEKRQPAASLARFRGVRARRSRGPTVAGLASTAHFCRDAAVCAQPWTEAQKETCGSDVTRRLSSEASLSQVLRNVLTSP